MSTIRYLAGVAALASVFISAGCTGMAQMHQEPVSRADGGCCPMCSGMAMGEKAGGSGRMSGTSMAPARTTDILPPSDKPMGGQACESCGGASMAGGGCECCGSTMKKS